MENSYWNMTGEAQQKYDEMENAGFQYTKATEKVFHSYYRYWNDGDLPGWARSRWDLTCVSYDYGYAHRVLNPRGVEEQENRITQQIELEYRRYLKTER